MPAIDSFTVRRGGRMLTFAGGTETGQRYRANFDVLHFQSDPPLAVVADGMGDSEGSALASGTAVRVFVGEVLAAGRPPDPVKLRAAVAAAQRAVRAAGTRVGGLTGTTLAAVLPTSREDAWIAHIGDSRVYRHRAGLLELLTADHTAAWLGAVYGWYPAAEQLPYERLAAILGDGGHPSDQVAAVLAATLAAGGRDNATLAVVRVD